MCGCCAVSCGQSVRQELVSSSAQLTAQHDKLRHMVSEAEGQHRRACQQLDAALAERDLLGSQVWCYIRFVLPRINMFTFSTSPPTAFCFLFFSRTSLCDETKIWLRSMRSCVCTRARWPRARRSTRAGLRISRPFARTSSCCSARKAPWLRYSFSQSIQSQTRLSVQRSPALTIDHPECWRH